MHDWLFKLRYVLRKFRQSYLAGLAWVKWKKDIRFWYKYNKKRGQRPLLRELIEGYETEQVIFDSSQAVFRYLGEVHHSLRRKEGVMRVVFFMSECAKWNAQSVYEVMEGDAACRPEVLLMPDKGGRKGHRVSQNEAFCKKFNLRYRHGMDERGEWVALHEIADVVFYEDPWCLEVFPRIFWPDVVNFFALTAYIPYGFMSARLQNSQFNEKFHQAVKFIFCRTPLHKALSEQYALTGGSNVFVSGSPKLDRYLAKRPQRLDAGFEKRIIWAPHADVKGAWHGSGTFLENYQFFIALAKKHSRIQWVLKPHPCLRESLVELAKAWTGEEYDAFLRQWDALPNTDFYDEGNYIDLFLDSDGLVTDCLSFLFEYLPTGKPIVRLESKYFVGFNEFGERFKKGFYTVQGNDAAGIEDFILDCIVGGRDPLKAVREELVQEELYRPEGGAGRFIMYSLKTRFFKEQRQESLV